MKTISAFFVLLALASLARAEGILIQAPESSDHSYQAYLQTFSELSSPSQFQLAEIKKDLSFSLKWVPILKEAQLKNENIKDLCSIALIEMFKKIIHQEDLLTLQTCETVFAKEGSAHEKHYVSQMRALTSVETIKESSFKAWRFNDEFPDYKIALINGVQFDLRQKPTLYLNEGPYQILLLSDRFVSIEHHGDLKDLLRKKNSQKAYVSGTCREVHAENIPLSSLYRSRVFFDEKCIANLAETKEPTLPPAGIVSSEKIESAANWWIPVGVLVGVGTLLYLSDKEVSVTWPGVNF